MARDIKLGCFSFNATLFGTKMGHVNLLRGSRASLSQMPFSTGTPLSACLLESHNELHKPVDSLQKRTTETSSFRNPRIKPIPFELLRKLFRHSLPMYKGLNSQDFPNLGGKFDNEIVLYLLQIEKATLLEKEHVINNILTASKNGSLDRDLAKEVWRVPGVIAAREETPQYSDLERILDTKKDTTQSQAVLRGQKVLYQGL